MDAKSQENKQCETDLSKLVNMLRRISGRICFNFLFKLLPSIFDASANGETRPKIQREKSFKSMEVMRRCQT